MSLVSIIFFLAGRLCCRANFIFAADLTLRGQLKLTCFRHIDYKCNYFLSFLFLTGFISDAMQFKHFLWLRFEDHGVYMMNLYWKEFAPLPDCRWERGCAPGWRSGGGGGGTVGILGRSTHEKFDIFRFSNVNLRTLGSPIWVKFPSWGELIRAHKTLWQHLASLESNY